MSENPSTDPVKKTGTEQYQVVALKYRPQAFESLIGQGHIAQALSNAINTNRVGHAYLFTGARGVGKTSSARIFAKCLNCSNGPTPEPCNECDICQSVSVGEDVDVLEIDGASNRGIDEIRQLRSNAAIRPSRGRYKIYIIDEVHMLTTQAFNALLKTLEEPPQHVKFIFCTTDPQKIPITVLSRCQRFDFSPVQTDEISKSLKAIAASEGVTASEEALALLARRANGSMRDSQSLLEQLFSFCGKDISVDEVHQLLGTTDMGRIAEIAGAIATKDTTNTLSLIHESVTGGVDAGQLTGQLLGYFRDMMAVRAGCGEDILLNCSSTDLELLQSQADELGMQTILTIVQMIDSAVVRMQSSLHKRTLLEVAAIRACSLESIDAISDLVNTLSSGGGGTTVARPAGRAKKTASPAASPKPAVKKNETQRNELGGGSTATGSVSEAAAAKLDPPSANEASQAVNSPTEKSSGVVSSPALASPDGNAAGSSASGPSGAAGVGVAAAASAVGAVAASVSSAVESNPLTATTVESGSVGINKTDTGTAPSNVSSKSSTTETNQQATPSSANLAAASPATAKPTGAVAELKSMYDKALASLGDMTSDTAANYAELSWVDNDRIEVAFYSDYNKKFCSKPDRKSKIETAFGSVIGRNVTIDFTLSKKERPQAKAQTPKLSRVQQIRELQDVAFVKEAVALFDGEIAGYFNPNERS